MIKMKIFYTFFICLCFSGATNTFAQNSAFDQMLNDLYHWTIPLITPAELEANGIGNFILLDAREKEEYEVSHIKGAKYIGYNQFNSEAVKNIKKDKPVIVYCSVGYRSERIGEKLKDMGFETVYNLYGGIFEWKNLGYEVVNSDGNKTEEVHAYNKKWGKWLQAGKKIY